MTSSLSKLNKSSGAHFLVIFSKNFFNFLMFLNIQIDLHILKTYHYGQFTLTTKKSLYIIYKDDKLNGINHACVIHYVNCSH